MASINAIKDDPEFFFKVKAFIFDLRSFKQRPSSRNRLETVIDRVYIGLPYFTDAQADLLKSLQVVGMNGSSTTLEILIQDTMAKRLETRHKNKKEQGDYRPCTAHDVAPIFERVFSIKWKPLTKNTAFAKLLDEHGLIPPL